MRILVAGKDDSTRRQLAATLQNGGYAVRTAQDNSGTLAALQQEAPQVVLLTVDVASSSALAQIRQIRAHARSASTHLVLVTPEVPEAFSIDAYRAGLDGEIRLPYAPDYLLARVGAIQRRLEPGAKVKVARAGTSQVRAAAPADATAAIRLVANARAWSDASSTLAVAAGKFLNLEAAVSDPPEPNHGLGLACAILLSNVEHQLELRIAVGIDDAAGRRLAIHLFGPEGDGLVPDMLGETANIFMGAMKTALSGEALAFTGGLPAAIPTELVARPAVPYRLQDVFCLAMGDTSLVVHLGLRSKANLDVLPAKLEEGMILAKDVFNGKGLLMVSAGTRLSLTMAEKLRALLPPKQSIEVMAG